MSILAFTKKKIKFSRTPSGVPVLWEKSKKFDGITRITIIFTPEGDVKESIFNRIGTSDSLVPIKDDDIIIKIFFEPEDVGISLLRIINIDKYSKYADIEVIQRKPPNSFNWIVNNDAKVIPEASLKKIQAVLTSLIKKMAGSTNSVSVIPASESAGVLTYLDRASIDDLVNKETKSLSIIQ